MSPPISGIITSFVLAVSVAFSTVTSSYAEWESKPNSAGSPLDLVNAVNALRASHGLAPYTISPILMYTAQSQADFLAATGTMTHTGPGGSGLSERLLAAGYPLAGELESGGFRAENITGGIESMSAQSAVDQWTGDALHLNTMTSQNLTEIGAGVAVSNGRVYYVIDCAHPITGGDSEVATSVTGSKLTAPARGAPIAGPTVSTPNSNGDVIHEVQFGQTLWQLAIAYNVKIDEIKGLNNLFDNSIYPGTKLLIKTGVIQPTIAQTETPADDLPVTPINALISTATIIQPALTSTKAVAPLPLSPPANTSTTMAVVIGIIVLALLGGGLFIWLGSSKK